MLLNSYTFLLVFLPVVVVLYWVIPRGYPRLLFLIAANLLYLLIPFINRSLVAKYYGFAETGQFSLAFDLGLRAVQAIGSALDVLLFQIAVAALDTHGVDKAKAQANGQ